MSYVRITWLAQILRAAGLKVVEQRGWQTAGRPSSKGSFDPSGVLIHHTGAGGSTNAPSLSIVTNGRSDLPGPLCHVLVGRDGTCYLIASGRANHAGRAKASGPMPAGDGNAMYVGFECENSSNQPWPAEQLAAMETAAAAVLTRLGKDENHCRGHKETSLEGKWDPGHVDMDTFRRNVAAAQKRLAKPVPAVVKPAPSKSTSTAAKVITTAVVTAGAVTGVNHVAPSNPVVPGKTTAPKPAPTQVVTKTVTKTVVVKVPTKPASLPVVSLSKFLAAQHHDAAAVGQPKSYAGTILVERALHAEGLLDAKYVDGSAGTATTTAYKAWQQKLGFRGGAADGYAGGTSLRELGHKHGFTVVD